MKQPAYTFSDLDFGIYFMIFVVYLMHLQVTLIHNLETFGIDPEEFAHNVQVNMACSSSISPLPGKNQGMEVLIQGNQINYIASLLIGKSLVAH